MSEPQYPTLHVRVSAEELEIAGAELFELGASGLEERDSTTIDGAAGAGTLIVAHFPDESSAREAERVLSGRHDASVHFIVGDAWREKWKEFFRPARVGERLVVRPPWEPWEAAPQDLVITLDPGQAFGTGTHETTRLVMRALETLVADGDEILDVGCGSGILGIAALLLGASRVVAVDVDPIAVRVTHENAEVNGVAIEASTTPIDDVEGRYPVVIANIRSPILIPMVEALAARMAAGARLVLSGLLVPEEDEVRAAFDARLEFVRRDVDGEWLALTYQREDA